MIGQDPSAFALNKYVVVRTTNAGVHTGILVGRLGQEVLLEQSRRIWNWQGANTISEIALHGIAKSSKVAEQVDAVWLAGAIEIHPCTAKAEKILRGLKWAE